MVKISKLSDLTDIGKLKELGSSLVDSSKVGNLVDKVKSTVGEPHKIGDLVGKMRNTVGLGEKAKPLTDTESPDSLQAQVTAIQQSLQALYEAQKQQVALMNILKKQVNHLITVATPASQTEAAPAEKTEEERTSNQDKDE